MAYGLTQSLRLTRASSQYTTIADNASISITGNITIELWVKMKETLSSGVGRFLVQKSTANTTNRSYELGYDNYSGTPGFKFYFFTGGTPTNFFEGKIDKTMTIDTWYHVAMTCTVANSAATKMAWYFDGVSAGAGTGTNFGSGATALYDGISALRLGQTDPVTAGFYIDAQFSLVRIWDTIRTGTEIADNICNVLGSTSNLKVEWTCDNTYADNSGNSNTMSGVNTPTFVTDTPSTCSGGGGGSPAPSLTMRGIGS